MAQLTGCARLVVVVDTHVVDQMIAFVSLHGCRLTAPMYRDERGWYVHQHELEAAAPARAEVADA